MTKYTDWRDKKVPPQKHDCDIWVEGRWIYYHPTVFPSHEVKEWGGRWEGKKDAWRLPKLVRLARRLLEYDPSARPSADVSRLATRAWDSSPNDGIPGVSDLETHPTYADLYSFQKPAVAALLSRGYHGLLLALSPGLGKTPTSIVAADLLGEEKRILVVCPLSLTRNWEREILKWSQYKSVEVCHQEPPTMDHSVRWTVTNPDTVLERVQDENTKRWSVSGNLHEEYDLDWDVVILDESVLYKNRKAKRTQAIRTLSRISSRVWELSGAPITRDNSDAWSQFNIMEPDYFSAFWRFANEFCVVVRTPWSQGEIQGSRRDIHLRDEFPELMYVRNQEEVLPDLPKYIWEDIPLRLTKKQQKAHDDILTDWIHMLEEAPEKRVEVTIVIAQLMRLQQVTSNLYNLETTGHKWPDESSKADFVCETLDRGDVEWPVLIWTHHRPGAFALKERLDKLTKKKDSALHRRRVALVYGGTRDADETIEAFKAGKVDVLILGIQVGKYGHTLVNTRTVITYDKTWDSDAWFQMLHRVRRNGLKHRPLVINPRCRGTVDDFVELNLAGKLPAMTDLTGGDLIQILRSLGEEHTFNA